MTPNPTASMAGKTIVITGATSGIGRSTAQALAAAGAHLVLAVRDTAKGQILAQDLPGTHVVRELDLADLRSVRSFAASFTERFDILINNAGVSASKLMRTADGFEVQFGTNHLGHFLLTNLLLEQITGRVVTVASQAERNGRIDLQDLNWEHREYKGSRAYADSKLANALFTTELARRFRLAGSSVVAVAAHPGLVRTAIYNDPTRTRRGVWDRLVAWVGQDPDQGALPVLLAATEAVPAGSMTGPEHLAHMRGGAQIIGLSSRARDTDLAQNLWAASEAMIDHAASAHPVRASITWKL